MNKVVLKRNKEGVSSIIDIIPMIIVRGLSSIGDSELVAST
jgi:hypothetical protein